MHTVASDEDDNIRCCSFIYEIDTYYALQAICNEIDARGEGVINFPTFLQIMQRPFPPPESEAEVIAAFEVIRADILCKMGSCGHEI